MKLLLDTHVLAWWLIDDTLLQTPIRELIGSQSIDVFVSSASCWEIATKMRLGKWPDAATLLPGLGETIAKIGFNPLAVSLDHAERAGLLDFDHKDPFDRLLAAQSLIEGLTPVSVDPVFRRLPGLSLFSQQH